MRRWGFILGLLVIAGALLYVRSEQQPSIRPEDVSIKAVLLPPGAVENPLYGHEGQWALEITLDSHTDRPLYVSERSWFSWVTPYTPGMREVGRDFKQGWSNGTGGTTVGGEGFVVGSDGRHSILAAEALRTQGVSITEEEVFQIMGFGYYGERLPAEIRYYLSDPESASSPGRRAFVVYSHYERRWGRDLSWAKAFPVDALVMP